MLDSFYLSFQIHFQTLLTYFVPRDTPVSMNCTTQPALPFGFWLSFIVASVRRRLDVDEERYLDHIPSASSCKAAVWQLLQRAMTRWEVHYYSHRSCWTSGTTPFLVLLGLRVAIATLPSHCSHRVCHPPPYVSFP